MRKYAVEIEITDNGTVNFHLFKEGELVGIDNLSPEDKTILDNELSSLAEVLREG